MPSRERGAPAAAAPGATGIAWIDVAIQTVIAAALVAGIVWVVTFGVFHKGVDVFTDWYVASVVPSFAIGVAPVVSGTDFRDGFFAPHPEAPVALTWQAPTSLDLDARFER